MTLLTDLLRADWRDRLSELADLPAWLTRYRAHQAIAIEHVMDAYERGAELVVVEAPPGSGKSLIGETVRRLLHARALYCCTTKTLQEQLARDFPHAAVLMGRANYPTLREDLYAGELSITAADCDKRGRGEEARCTWCDPVYACPYERAKRRALSADLAILNTAYLLTESNGPGRFSNANLTIIDEADLLEHELMRHVEVRISKGRAKQFGIRELVRGEITKPDKWHGWLDDAMARVHDMPVYQKEPVQKIREIRYRANLLDRLRGLHANTDGWVYTGRDGEVSFKPVRVADIGPAMVWRHSKRWLLMSATIIHAKQTVEEDLGFAGAWEYVSVPSVFDVKNRPVKVIPTANMSRKGQANGALDQLTSACRTILARHSGEQVLLHSVSYEVAHRVGEALANCRPVFTYERAGERGSALDGFRASSSGVLVAPSMDRGVDLPDDLCRVIVVAKVPYAYLGDRQVSARLHQPGGQLWYELDAVRSLIQMTGRGVRHDADWCTTYVLDSQFLNLWNRTRAYIPEWFKEGLVWGEHL